MKKFKEVIEIIGRPIGILCCICGGCDLLVGDYKLASWALLIASTIFMVGYFTERWST